MNIYNLAKQEIDFVINQQTQQIKYHLLYQPTFNINMIETSSGKLSNIAKIELLHNKATITPFDVNNKNILKVIKQTCNTKLSFYANVTEDNNSIVITWYQLSSNIKNYQIKQLDELKNININNIRNIRQQYMKKVNEILDKNLKFSLQKQLDELIKTSQQQISKIYDNYNKNL